MPDNTDEVRIPVDVDADTAGLKEVVKAAEEAERSIDRIAAATKRLAGEMAGLRTATVGTTGAASTAADATARAARTPAGAASTAEPRSRRPSSTAEDPEERRLAYERQRNLRLERQAYERQASTPDERRSTFEQQVKRASERADWARQMGLGTTFSQKLGGTVLSPSGIASMMALMQGNAGVLGSVLTDALTRTITSPFATGTRRGATLGSPGGPGILSTAAESATNAVRGEAVSAAASAGGEALGSAATGGLAGAGEEATAGGAMGLLGGAGALAAGVAALAGAGFLYGNAKTTEALRRQVDLLSTAGGRGNIQQVTEDVLGGGGRFQFEPDTTMKVAEGLGGVPMNQINANVQNTMALARLSGRNPNDLTDLTRTMAIESGQNAEDIAKSFQGLEQQSRRANVPLGEMIDSLKTLEDTSGGIVTNNTSIQRFAALQAMLGPGINAGAFMSPTMGATGVSAMSKAALLQMSQDQFARIQGNAPALFDAIAAQVRRAAAGQHGAAAINMGEAFLSGTQLGDMQGLGPAQQRRIVQMMLAGHTRQAQDFAQQQLKLNQILPGGDWRGQVAHLSEQITSDADRAKIALLTEIATRSDSMAGNIQRMADALAPEKRAPLDKAGDYVKNGVVYNKAGKPYVGGLPAGWTRDSYGNPLPPMPGRAAETTFGAGETLAGTQVGGYGDATYAVPNTRGDTETVSGPLASDYEMASRRFGVPVADLLAIGARESDFTSNKTAPDGGMGIAQFMQGTLNGLAKDQNSPIFGKSFTYDRSGKNPDPSMYFNPYNAGEATNLQAYYYSTLLQREQGNRQLALRDYNGAGPAAETYGQQTYGAAQNIHVTVEVAGTVTNKDQAGNVTGVGRVAGTGAAKVGGGTTGNRTTKGFVNRGQVYGMGQ